MTEEEKLTEHERLIVKATVKEFMEQVYSGIGKTVLERLFWVVVGFFLFWYFGWHIPK